MPKKKDEKKKGPSQVKTKHPRRRARANKKRGSRHQDAREINMAGFFGLGGLVKGIRRLRLTPKEDEGKGKAVVDPLKKAVKEEGL